MPRDKANSASKSMVGKRINKKSLKSVLNSVDTASIGMAAPANPANSQARAHFGYTTNFAPQWLLIF